MLKPLLSGLILGFFVHIGLRVAFSPRFLKKWLKKGVESEEFHDKMSFLVRSQVQDTFLKVGQQIPFAAPFLTSDFAKRIETGTTDMAVDKLEDFIVENTGSMVEVRRVLWWITLGAFILGFLTEVIVTLVFP